MPPSRRRSPAARTAPAGLWRHRDFLLLWSGQSVSELGTAVSFVVFPLTAVVSLHASTLAIGLLSAATTVPFLVIALPAGLIVDRLPKRGLMLACDVARTLVMGSVPVAAAFGVLTLGQLYLAALLAGIGAVFFDVAYQSYLPSLVGMDQLVDGNGKLAATRAFSEVAGPGMGGGLYGLLRAGAVTADAVSYAVSALSLLLIRTREARPDRRPPRAGRQAPSAAAGEAPRTRLRAELLAGLSFVARHRVLRKIAASTATANLFFAMVTALEVLFLVRSLHIKPSVTGLVVAAGGVGGVAGGITAGRAARLIGSARIIWVAPLVFGSTTLLMPLAEPGWRIAFFVIGFTGFAFSGVQYNIAQLSYRQAVCPPELLGRMNAAVRWIVWGTLPLGGALGGVLGTALGVRATIAIGGVGAWAAGWWVFFSPLRRMRDIPGIPAVAASPTAAAGTPPAGAPGVKPPPAPETDFPRETHSFPQN
jgi:MFS family permease